MEKLALAEAKTDNGGGVQLPNGDEPIAPNEDSNPIRTLTQRMMDIRKESSGVGKEDIQMQNKERTKKWTIQAHTIEGVLHGVRVLFDRHGVWLQPNLVERTFSGNRCDAIFEFSFEMLTPLRTKKTILWAGSGTDNSDKGFAKAGTNALKEMLKKVFLITDRQDADEEVDRTEFRPTGADVNEEVTKANTEAEGAILQWANTFRPRLRTQQTQKTLRA